MKVYFSNAEAVIDLHDRDFTEDFQLLGNNILWIQGNINLRPKDFSIVESHSFIDSLGKETIIFAVITNGFLANGILINHYYGYPGETSAIANCKLKKGALSLFHTIGNHMDKPFARYSL